MAATAGPEVRLALTGALRLARGDRRGLACFDATADGFWRSFRAAVLGYPLYLVLLLMRIGDAEWARSGAFRVVTAETIGYAVTWLAFPVAMVSITRWLGRDTRFFGFVTVYNWCQLPEMVLFVLIALQAQSGLLPKPASQFLEVVAAVAVLAYEWYIARVALETSMPAAAGVVLVSLVLGLLISQVTEFLY
jgi:hypothetical protein